MMEDEDNQTEETPAENQTGDESFDGEEEEKGGKKKLILIIVALLLLLGGGGAAAYFTGALDSLLGKKDECVEEVDEDGNVIEECPEEEEGKGDDEKGKDDDKKEGKDKKGKKDKKDKKGKKGKDGKDGKDSKGGGKFLEIPTMIVNLNTESGTPRYLRLTVQLEMANEEDVAEVEAVLPRVIDQFQTYLRELRVRDLRGSAGIYRLQMELLWRVNQAAAPVEVKDVLFQEILIQ